MRISGMIAVLFLMCFTVSAAERDDVTPWQGKAGRDRLGMAITPANFPKHSNADLDAAFQQAAKLSTYTVFISQWGRLNPDAVKLIVSKARDNGMKLVLGLSPTLLTGGRKALDVPEVVRQAASGKVSFTNPGVREEFVKAAVSLAEYKPAFLCLATEINLLALGNLREYLFFAHTYREAYKAVKKISPDTQVFVSFQWEIMRLLDEKQPKRLHAHGKIIDIFRPTLDVIALTSYPSPHFTNPAALPTDYYQSIYNHADHSEPLMLMELGWPSEGSGSPQEQVKFVQRLPELFKGMRIEVLAWSLLHDVNLNEFNADLNTTGLFESSGQAKKAAESFRNLQ